MINGLLTPGYVRFDGNKFVTDDTVQITGPAGPPGAQGLPGISGTNGQNAFTTLTASFVQPVAGIGNPINISVASTSSFAVNQIIYIANGGYYYINIVTPNTLNVYNLGYSENTSPGNTIPNSSLITPAGSTGALGGNSYTTLSASFIQPAIDGAILISVVSSNWSAVGQTIYIESAGYYTVSSIPNTTSMVIINLGYTGNTSPGFTAGGIGSKVTPAGIIGTSNPTYVGDTFPSMPYTDAPRTTIFWFNDTVDSVTVNNLYFIPTEDITASDTDNWKIFLALGSDPTTPLLGIVTKVTPVGPGVVTTSLTAGVSVAFDSDLVVPSGDCALLKIQIAGTPTILGGLVQGRVSI